MTIADTSDDLSRPVYGVFGIPVDAIDHEMALRIIRTAVAKRQPFLLSTPNLNFLIQSWSDPEFRNSLIRSDLCTADGAPIVWLARLLGAPLKQRVAGSDILDALKAGATRGPPLRIFLFGGPQGVAERACESLNRQGGGLTCVGSLYPGFVHVDAMSTETIISTINASRADFLSVSLGAQKGQAWLIQNHDRLEVPIRAHLGATINFQAGDVQRAPTTFRNSGLEWLWRVKEEPHLWQRYWQDGRKLLKLLVTRAIPLIAWLFLLRLARRKQGLDVTYSCDGITTVVSLSGSATAPNVERALPCLRGALSQQTALMIDMAATDVIDARFTGLLVMLKKQTRDRGGVQLINVPVRVRKFLTLNRFEYLLEPRDPRSQHAAF